MWLTERPFFGFLNLKQGRYYVETNYLEDVLAAGSFFHYAGGFNKPKATDLTLPEVSLVGKIKDTLFPSPRLDFYACVQAKKRKDSLHGQNTIRDPAGSHRIEGIKFRPKPTKNPNTDEIGPGVYL